jgi:iron complex outermembrane receptor protein
MHRKDSIGRLNWLAANGRRCCRPLLLAASSASVLALAPAVAMAQSTPASAGGAPANASEVIVTATKRAEPVKKVPAAISVLSARQLQTAGVTEMRDLNGLVPGLLVSGGVGSGEFVIRGLDSTADASPVTGLQIDGAPIGPVSYASAGATQLPEIDPSSVARIEVLKGPQGTLYGGSTLGGIVQFVTRKPNLDQAEGSIYVEGSGTEGGDGNYVVRAAASAPIVQDKLGFQISAYDNDLGGFIDDRALGDDKFDYHHAYGGRVAVLWQVNPDFQVEVSDLYSRQISRLDAVPYTPSGHPLNGDLTYNEGALPVYDSTFNMVALNATYDLHWATLSYIGTYQKIQTAYAFSYDQSPLTAIIEDDLPVFGGVTIPAGASLAVRSQSDTSKYTSELRLASPDQGRVRWLVGMFYNNESTNAPEEAYAIQPDQAPAPGPLGGLISYDLLPRLQEISGFGDLTFYITPQLDVTGGVRVGQVNQTYEQLAGGSDLAAENLLSTLIGFAPTPADTGVKSASENVETYLANVRYHLSPNDMVYFRYATGFRVGGPNDTVPGLPATFAPDTTQDYEIGWKTNFWDNRGYLDLDVYNINWDNIQVPIESEGLSGLTNGGTAISRGVEASVNLTPIKGLSLTASGAYNDAHLTQIAVAGVGRPGDPLPNAPKWSGSFGANYEWELGDDWRPFVGGQVRYVDERHYTYAHSAFIADYIMPAYTLVDVQAGVRHGPYEVTVFARNLGNERAQLGDYSLGANFLVVQRPLTIGASFGAHF